MLLKRTAMLSLALLVPSVHAMVTWKDAAYSFLGNNKKQITDVVIGGIGVVGMFYLAYKLTYRNPAGQINCTPETLTEEDSFDQFAGKLPEAVNSLRDMVANPEPYTQVKAKLSKGFLLAGASGVGKTAIARAAAYESKCLFFSISASDFVQIYSGAGAKRMVDFIESIYKHSEKQKKKAFVLIDELDAIGSRERFSASESGEREQTINKLLEVMTEKRYGNIIWFGATNRPDAIDPALKRPGRFSWIVEIPLPNKEDRKAIIRHYAKKIVLDSGFKKSLMDESNILDELVKGTKGFTGADIKELCNNAAIAAGQKRAQAVTYEHFQQALKDMLDMRKNKGKSFLTGEGTSGGELTYYS